MFLMQKIIFLKDFMISYNKQNETNFYAALGSLKKFISENQNNNYQILESSNYQIIKLSNHQTTLNLETQKH